MKKNKRPSVLPKKLNELHHLINEAFLSQPDSPNIQHIHADIEQRLTFVKNLLSAEMASHPAKQSYLENMSERARELEAAYRGSGTGSSTTISTIDHVDNDDNDDDHASNCSCPGTLVQEDYGSDDLESTLGHDTGVCVDMIEEKKAMPVTMFNNVLFEGKVDDDNDGVEDEFRDHVENVLFDDMSRNGVSVEDEQEEKEEMEEENEDEEEMEEKQIRADVDLKKSEKKKKGLGFGKFCAGFVIGMFSMAFIISLEYEAYEGGHGHFLAPT